MVVLFVLFCFGLVCGVVWFLFNVSTKFTCSENEDDVEL